MKTNTTKGGKDLGEPALLKAKSAMQATTGPATSMPAFLPAKHECFIHYCSESRSQLQEKEVIAETGRQVEKWCHFNLPSEVAMLMTASLKRSRRSSASASASNLSASPPSSARVSTSGSMVGIGIFWFSALFGP